MQPLIGVFTIPIGEILFEQNEKRQKDLEGLDKLIEELEKVMNDLGAVTYNIQD